jgi:ligand-binding sensor domain-containing protein
MMKKILYLIVGLVCVLSVKAQPDCFFTHYSSEDGLSQNTVMSILQDRKGNMWFATWDGINKFNGYSFKTYKARLDNRIVLSHNRVDHMVEDKYGFLWLQTYDNHAYRFDPRTEAFERVPAEGERGSVVNVTKIEALPGGAVWLLTETEGAIRIATNPEDYSLTSQWYSAQSGQFSATRVFGVYEDLSGNEWILSDNGLGMLAAGQTTPASYFVDAAEREKKGGQAFYSCLEYDSEIYFGSDNGRVWCYQKGNGQFQLQNLPASSRIVSINSVEGNELIFTTAKDGFFSYQPKTKAIEHFPASRFPNASIHSVYVDKASEVWFEQHIPGTVVHFNPRTRILKQEKVPVEPTSTDRSRPAFHIHEDINGVLWVHPYGGGFSYFDRKSNSLHPFYNSLSGSDWRFSNKIHAAFSDRQGVIYGCVRILKDWRK